MAKFTQRRRLRSVRQCRKHPLSRAAGVRHVPCGGAGRTFEGQTPSALEGQAPRTGGQLRRRRARRGGSVASALYRSAANAYRRRFCSPVARPLLDGEYHPLCANFEGPGTRIDLPAVRNAMPINRVDAAAKEHDLDYAAAARLPAADGRALAVHEADRRFLQRVRDVPAWSEQPYRALGLAGIQGKARLDQLLSLLSRRPRTAYGGRTLSGGAIRFYDYLWGQYRNISNGNALLLLRDCRETRRNNPNNQQVLLTCASLEDAMRAEGLISSAPAPRQSTVPTGSGCLTCGLRRGGGCCGGVAAGCYCHGDKYGLGRLPVPTAYLAGLNREPGPSGDLFADTN